jgi:tetraacyldisaccharide 4'-kinase
MFPFALVYGLIVTLRRKFYDWHLLAQTRLPGRTISVGNLSLGGTGKTPLVIAFARRFVTQGRAVCVLTRGYGSDLRKHDLLVLQGGEVLFQSRAFQQRPDEAFLISSQVPKAWVVVGPKRARNAERLMKELGLIPEVWVLDDGFQHLALARDFDLLLLSGRQATAGQGFMDGFKWPCVLPLGPWREFRGQIGRAHCVLLTKTTDATAQEELRHWLKRRWPQLPIGLSQERFLLRGLKELSLQDMQELKERGVAVLCAIADPGRLVEQLQLEGFKVLQQKIFPDHEKIPQEALKALAAGTGVVTTSKDLARQPEMFASYEHLNILICDYEMVLPKDLFTMSEHHG